MIPVEKLQVRWGEAETDFQGRKTFLPPEAVRRKDAHRPPCSYRKAAPGNAAHPPANGQCPAEPWLWQKEMLPESRPKHPHPHPFRILWFLSFWLGYLSLQGALRDGLHTLSELFILLTQKIKRDFLYFSEYGDAHINNILASNSNTSLQWPI